MKTNPLLTSLLMMTALAACQNKKTETGAPNNVVAAATPASATSVAINLTEEGGISGGGGGTLPAEPLSTYNVNEIIAQAKTSLRLLTNYYDEKQFPMLSPALETKLYQGKQTIKDILDTTDIEIRMDKPCLDSAGHEVDGSIFANRPNTVCLSAFRIAPKVSKETAASEIKALIMHELSHLLGTTEIEAVEFQKKVKNDLLSQNDEITENFLKTALEKLDEATVNLQSVVNLHFQDPDTMDSAIPFFAQEFSLYSNFTEHLRNFDTHEFSLGSRELNYLDFLFSRLRLANYFAQCHSKIEDAKYACQVYENLMGGKESVSYQEYSTNDGFPELAKGDFSGAVIQRIHNPQEMTNELSRIQSFLQQVKERLFTITYGQALSVLTIPDDAAIVNPWEKAKGIYTFTSKVCSKKGLSIDTDTGFEIDSHDGHLWMKRFFQNGSGEVDLNHGGSDVNGGATVTVGENADGIYRNAMSGDLWNFERMSTYRSNYLLNLNSATPTLTVSFDEKTSSHTSTHGAQYYHDQCVFQLTKNP